MILEEYTIYLVEISSYFLVCRNSSFLYHFIFIAHKKCSVLQRLINSLFFSSLEVDLFITMHRHYCAYAQLTSKKYVYIYFRNLDKHYNVTEGPRSVSILHRFQYI